MLVKVAIYSNCFSDGLTVSQTFCPFRGVAFRHQRWVGLHLMISVTFQHQQSNTDTRFIQRLVGYELLSQAVFHTLGYTTISVQERLKVCASTPLYFNDSMHLILCIWLSTPPSSVAGTAKLLYTVAINSFAFQRGRTTRHTNLVFS